MPSRNIVRLDADNQYYHVYGRGANKSTIFIDSVDKDYFLSLLSRHLSTLPFVSSSGYVYPHYNDDVELLSYCIMDNHFHLLVFQLKAHGTSRLMQSLLTAYTAYFNRKYQRRGPLLESRFKASLVDKDPYLTHVSRYIHLNPRSWKYFPYSSIIHIRKGTEPEWLKTDKVLADYPDRKAYLRFIADYEASRDALTLLKHQLADL